MANAQTKKKRNGDPSFLGVLIDSDLLEELDVEAERSRGADPSANRSRTIRALIREALDARAERRGSK